MAADNNHFYTIPHIFFCWSYNNDIGVKPYIFRVKESNEIHFKSKKPNTCLVTMTMGGKMCRFLSKNAFQQVSFPPPHLLKH